MSPRRQALVRKAVMVAAAVVIATGLGACGRPEQQAVRDLRQALTLTKRVAHRFSYEEVALDGTKIEVQGLVEDDLRRQTFVRVDDKPVFEEVVHDDRLLVRFLEPGYVPQLVRAEAPITAGARPEGEINGRELGAALAGAKWVADDAGAPSALAGGASERHPLGDDPVYDATTVLDYVERVSRRSPIRKFNPDALDYKPKEDPFPKPAKGSGVVRYDTERWPVPKPSDTSSGNQAIPSEVHFRKLAVYVKDGLVVQVLEDIAVADRLDDVVRNYDLDLEGTTEEQIQQAVDAINVVRKGQGELEPLRVRKMSLRIEDHRGALRVRVPTEDVKANLAVLKNRGKVTASRTGPTASADSTAPTLPVEPAPAGDATTDATAAP